MSKTKLPGDWNDFREIDQSCFYGFVVRETKILHKKTTNLIQRWKESYLVGYTTDTNRLYICHPNDGWLRFDDDSRTKDPIINEIGKIDLSLHLLHEDPNNTEWPRPSIYIETEFYY